MRFVPYEIKSGAENMRIDAELLEHAINNQLTEPVFRLYGWYPACVSLGRNQKSDFLDKKFLKENNIDVVRRLTGGRALLHDNEITYSYVCPVSSLQNGENVAQSYKEISQILINSFRTIGIELDFGGVKKPQGHLDYCMLVSTGADLCYQGRKLIGSAQFRKEGYILQHGSILYDYDCSLIEKVFNAKADSSALTSIKKIRPGLTQKDVINILSKCIL